MKPTMKARRSEEIISGPAPLTITHGERTDTLLVSPPTPSDLYSFRKWARKNAFSLLDKVEVDRLTPKQLEGLSPEQQRVILQAYGTALAASRPRDLSAEDVLDLTLTPQGAAMMVWLAARRHRGGLTLEYVQSLIDESNVEKVVSELDELTAPEDGETGTPDPKADGAAS